MKTLSLRHYCVMCPLGSNFSALLYYAQIQLTCGLLCPPLLERWPLYCVQHPTGNLRCSHNLTFFHLPGRMLHGQYIRPEIKSMLQSIKRNLFKAFLLFQEPGSQVSLIRLIYTGKYENNHTTGSSFPVTRTCVTLWLSYQPIMA